MDGEVGLDLLLQRFELFNTPVSCTPGKGKGRDLGLEREREVSSPITRSITTARVNHNSNLMQIDSQRHFNKANPDVQVSTRPTIAPSPLSNRTNITVNSNSNSNTHARSSAHAQVRQTGKLKPFKTPFLNPTSVRSSPRRTAQPSPLRALPMQTPTRAHVKAHNANVDIGEDEPEGNDSFDSFDGMFQEGGPEVEELFRAVDGS